MNLSADPTLAGQTVAFHLSTRFLPAWPRVPAAPTTGQAGGEALALAGAGTHRSSAGCARSSTILEFLDKNGDEAQPNSGILSDIHDSLTSGRTALW